MRRVWLIVPAVVLAVPVAAVVAANVMLSGEAVRTRLQEQVRRATGRELTIAGPVRLAWSLSPTVELHDVSLANPPGFSRPMLAHVDAIEARISLLPLLAHRVDIDSLLLAAPDVLLERDAAGRANWDFTRAPGPAPTGPAAAPSGGGRFDLELGRVELRDGQIAWAGGRLLLPRFGYDRRDGQVRGELIKSGATLALTGTAGPIAGTAWPLALQVAGGGVVATLSGTSEQARLAATAADLSAVSHLAGWSLPRLQDIRLKATVGTRGVSDLQLRIGASPLGGGAVQFVSVTAPTWTGPAAVQGKALLGALPVAIQGEVGALASLAGGKATPITLSATANDAQLDAHGEFSPGGLVVVDLTGHAGDLARLGIEAKLALPSLHDLRLATKVTFTSVTVATTELQVTSAEGDVAGPLSVTTSGPPAVVGSLTSTKLNLDALVPARLPEPAPTPPAQSTTPSAPVAASPRVIPDVRIPYDTLEKSKLALNLHVGEAIWHGRTAHDLIVDMSTPHGQFALRHSGIAFGDKRLSISLAADPGAQSVALQIDGAGLPAGAVLALLGASGGSGGVLDVRADLKGQGETLRAVLATLSGSAGLALVDAEIDNAWLQGMLAAANLPLEAGGRSTVRCAAFAADATGGRVTWRALSLDSSKLRLDGEGEVNLADETLDLHLSPQVRLGTALSVPIRLRGTLRSPKVVLDAGAIAPGRVGILLGGPAAPDTCGPALAVARGGKEGPAPAVATPTPSRPVKPADLLRSLLR